MALITLLCANWNNVDTMGKNTPFEYFVQLWLILAGWSLGMHWIIRDAFWIQLVRLENVEAKKRDVISETKKETINYVLKHDINEVMSNKIKTNMACKYIYEL